MHEKKTRNHKMCIFALPIHKARMAELVDALVSGTSIRKDVQVRVLFRAQKKEKTSCKSDIYKGFVVSQGNNLSM